MFSRVLYPEAIVRRVVREMYPAEMTQVRSARVNKGSTIMARPSLRKPLGGFSSLSTEEAEPGFLNDFMNNTSPILKLWVVLMASYLAFIIFMP